MENDLQKENQLLLEQIKVLQAQLHNRETLKNDCSRINDQSSFFSTFKQSTPRGNISRDQSKRDLQDLTAQVKRLNEEKEQMRKTLKHQTEAYDQKIQLKEMELSQKEKMYRQLQNDYKELQQQLIQEQSKPAPQPAIPQQQQTPAKPIADQIQQYRVQKVGLMNLPCLIIIRRNIFEQFVIEIETTKDKVTLNVSDITDLVPDRTKEDHFQLTYKQSNQKITEVYQSQEYKQLLRVIKYLHTQQQQAKRQEAQPVQQQVEQQSGLIKSLSSFFMKK